MIDVVSLQDAFNNECIALVTSDDIVRQEMAYNRERKHTMKKRAKKLRLRMSQRSVRDLVEETAARHSTAHLDRQPMRLKTHNDRISLPRIKHGTEK